MDNSDQPWVRPQVYHPRMVTIIHLSAAPNPRVGPPTNKIFKLKIFLETHFLKPQIFLTNIFFQILFQTKNFIQTKNLFWPKVFCTHNFFGTKNFRPKIICEPKISSDP